MVQMNKKGMLTLEKIVVIILVILVVVLIVYQMQKIDALKDIFLKMFD